MNSRRTFLKTGLVGVSGVALAGLPLEAAEAPLGSTKPKDDRFHLGVAGYSFVHFNLSDSLVMMKRMGIEYLCIKDFHLPLNSTEAEIKVFHQKLAAHGVTGYAVGPIYMTKSREEIDNAFAYAKRVGVDIVVGIPNKEDLAYIAEKTAEFDIKYAIHNHGPEDKLYPNATVIYDLVRNLDKRVGMCFDMGHNMRDGQDPIRDLKRYVDRIFDIHLKNVTSATADGKTCELGRGVIDIPAFVRMLRKVGYAGKCSLEYEKDMKDPLAGLAESTGYFRGVLDGTR